MAPGHGTALASLRVRQASFPRKERFRLVPGSCNRALSAVAVSYGLAATLILWSHRLTRWFIDPVWDLGGLALAGGLLVICLSTTLAIAARSPIRRLLAAPALAASLAASSVLLLPVSFALDPIGAALYLRFNEAGLDELVTTPPDQRAWPRALIQYEEPTGFALVFGGVLDNTWGLAYLEGTDPMPEVGRGFAGARLTGLERLRGSWYLFYTT